MQSAKESAKHIIDKLPDTATTNDILKELYVQQKVERGIQASDKDEVTPQEEVVKRYKK